MSSSKKKQFSCTALAPPQTSTPNHQVSSPKAKAPLKPISPAVAMPKQNPNQMQTAEYPKAFDTVKVIRASMIIPPAMKLIIIVDFRLFSTSTSKDYGVYLNRTRCLPPLQSITSQSFTPTSVKSCSWNLFQNFDYLLDWFLIRIS